MEREHPIGLNFPQQERSANMPGELLVILGAEATMLVFVAAMTLHAKRMDVLSGRSFERSVVSPTGNRHPLRSISRKTRDLLRLIRRWNGLTTFARLNLLRRFYITRMPRSGLHTRQQTPSRLGMCFRRAGRPAADASACAPPAPTDGAPVPNACSRALPSSATPQRSLNARSA